MTAIMQALGAGYGEEEILKFLSKTSPSLSKSISKAKSTGYSVSNILSFLDKTMKDDEYDPYLSQEASHKKVANQRERKTKQLLKSAATTGALIGAGRAIPTAIQGIKGALKTYYKPPPIPASPPPIPGMGTSAASNIGPKPMSGAPITPPPVNASSPVAPGTPIQPQAAQPVQPPQQNAPNVNSAQIINDMGIGAQVKNLAEAGNDPEAIATAVGISLKPHQKKWLEDQMKTGNAKPLPEMISDFLANSPNNEKISPEIAENVQKQPQNEQIEPSKPIEKGSFVATPSGESGSIKSLRDKEALIDEDGKLHKVKKEDLVQIPENIRNQNFEEILDKYFEQFPEQGEGSLSDNLSATSYSPQDGMLVSFIDSPNKLYLYRNVEPDLYETIASGKGTTRTSGGSGLPGTWNVGLFDSRGGPFQQVKENPEKYPFSIFDVKYNMFGDLAKTLKEKRLRKKREDREKQKRSKSS